MTIHFNLVTICISLMTLKVRSNPQMFCDWETTLERVQRRDLCSLVFPTHSLDVFFLRFQIVCVLAVAAFAQAGYLAGPPHGYALPHAPVYVAAPKPAPVDYYVSTDCFVQRYSNLVYIIDSNIYSYKTVSSLYNYLCLSFI